MVKWGNTYIHEEHNKAFSPNLKKERKKSRFEKDREGQKKRMNGNTITYSQAKTHFHQDVDIPCCWKPYFSSPSYKSHIIK